MDTSIVMAAIDKVGSTRCDSSCVTGTCVKIDVPRSPCISLAAHSPNCRHSGSSRPNAVCSLAMSSAVAKSPAISAAGSPGDRWISRNTITATTAMTGTMASTRRMM
ncbi:hypothetical protein D3C72_1342780 [compost metagenome]